MDPIESYKIELDIAPFKKFNVFLHKWMITLTPALSINSL